VSAPQRWPWDLRPQPDPVWRLSRLSCCACRRKVLVVDDLPGALTSYIPHRIGCPDLIRQLLDLVMTGRWHSPEADEPGFYHPDPEWGQR